MELTLPLPVPNDRLFRYTATSDILVLLANIEVEEGYLKLHGGRRGLGDLLYRVDRGHAQGILRHKDLATTQQACQHIDAEERGEQLDRYLEDTSE